MPVSVCGTKTENVFFSSSFFSPANGQLENLIRYPVLLLLVVVVVIFCLLFGWLFFVFFSIENGILNHDPFCHVLMFLEQTN